MGGARCAWQEGGLSARGKDCLHRNGYKKVSWCATLQVRLEKRVLNV